VSTARASAVVVLGASLGVILVGGLAACGASRPPPDPRPRSAGAAGPRRLAAAEKIAVADATLEAPAAWWVTAGEGTVALEDPDRQLRVVIVATADKPAADAIAAAWRRTTPGFALAAEAPDEPPPEDGWDATTIVHYTAPAAGTRAARAEWRRAGARGYVALVEGDRNALDRRDAQIVSIVGSLRPAGMREESFVGRPARAPDAARLDAFVGRALAELAVPGAAVAVILDGKVVYERTFGVRALGQPAPITPDTRFLIASVTKPMTTFMEAALVDAGTLRWDTPVTALLPGFALADPEFTRQLVLWHMSCACTGMPRQDLESIFEWDHVTPEARIAAMRAMRPTTRLGETFQYSNPMVAAGGYAAAHAFAPDRPLAAAYAAAMQAKVFGPIGMTSTTLDFDTVARGDHAVPHALALDGTTRAMPLAIERAVEAIAPAGGVWTTLRDMERYVETELAEGVAPGGARVVSAAALRERNKLRVRSEAKEGYGLGIDVGTYAGLRMLMHNGGAFGFGTTMFMLPDARAGIVIFTNVRNGGPKQQLPFNAAVTRRIVEELFPGARALADRQLAYYAGLRRVAPRPPSPAADRGWIAPLAGTYRDAALGEATIRETADGAVFDAGEWQSAIDRVVDADGTVQLVLLDPPFAGGKVLVDLAGTLRIPGQTTYVFTRIGAR
jgi:CubicO group peptidase (beta-lactamase class C family)